MANDPAYIEALDIEAKGAGLAESMGDWLSAIEHELDICREGSFLVETRLGRRMLQARRQLLEAFRGAAIMAGIDATDIRILLGRLEGR